MSIAKKKIVIISGAIILIIVLYILPTRIIPGKEEATKEPDFTSKILSEAKSSLKRQEAEPVATLEAAVEKAGKNTLEKALLLDSLAHTWQRLQVPALAAHYFEAAAALTGVKDEINAGALYYEAFNLATDTAFRSFLLRSATRNYEKAVKDAPDNLDAKSDLALCYADGNNPMQGILLLREVVTKNPANENAQYNLGILAIRSGQFNKAIERFSKVIEINPSRYDVYFLRGSAYMRLGQNEEARKDFEKVKKESGDAALISQADNYINELRMKNEE